MGMIELIIFLVVMGAVLGYAASLYNRLVFLKNQCDRAWANIDVVLKQRHDEIPKLVNVCEGYMKYERETLERVIQARNAATSARDTKDRIQKETQLTSELGRLFALAENYPDLKSQEMFMQLQGRISQIESEIADRREFYNAAATNHNIAVEALPTNIVANFAGYGLRDLFQVAEADKKDVEIKFKMP
jgi:LemA protein